jgi:CTP:molybdopterin cytidylyltransferase MocA
MMGLSGDAGARGLLQQYAAEVRGLPFPDDSIFMDVDDPDALAALSSR